MSILRSDITSGIMRKSTGKTGEKGSGISVTCPKCQSTITFTALKNDEPVRCGKCHYPMICRSDLFLIIEACKKVETAQQAGYAVSVLRRLAAFMPEAGTALGMLPTRLQSLSMNEQERWNMLESAYAAGDDNAREGLALMYKSSPGIYEAGFCSHCGAVRYYEKNNRGRIVCPYCKNAD